VNKKQLGTFKDWIENHSEVLDDIDTFWYIQNVIGSILGWSKEYIEYVTRLESSIKREPIRMEYLPTVEQLREEGLVEFKLKDKEE